MAASHKLWIACVVVGVTLAVAIWMLRTPDYFVATARLEIAMERPGRVGDAADEAARALVSSDPAYFNTQLQLITNPALLRRVIVELDLEHNPSFIRYVSSGGRLLRRLLRLRYVGSDDVRVDLKGPPPPPAAAEMQRLAPYVAELERRLTVRPVLETRTAFRETRMVDVVFQHPVPALASAVTNRIVDAFVSENRDRARRSGAATNAYLSSRIEALQGGVRQSEEALLGYGHSNQIVSLEPGQNVIAERLVSLNRQLLEAENDRKLAQANLQEAARPDAAPGLAAEAAKGVLSDSEIRLAELRAKRAQLLVWATEEWPEVRQISQQIASLETNLGTVKQDAVDVALGSLDTRYRQALAHEFTLRADFEKQRRLIDVQNQAAVTYRLMQQEVKTKHDLLAQALSRLGENDLAQAGVANNASVLEYAIVPSAAEPDGPWRLPAIAAACVFSLLTALGVAITREQLNQTLRSRSDVESRLDLQAIGLIRAAPSNPLAVYSPATSRRELDEFAEDYRRLRTAMLLPSSHHDHKCWLVTSSHPGEGKTTTAINLAASLVHGGAKVLLIDGDLRRPRLHSLLDIDNTRGLSTLLTSPWLFRPGVSFADDGAASPSRVITLHAPTGVHVLPSGPESLSALELLGSERMTALLASLRSSYNVVIIDSPPITMYIDGLVMAPMVDEVLLVVKASTTPLEVVRYARQLLHRVGATVSGVVLNRVVPLANGYYGYPAESDTATKDLFRGPSQAS